MLIPIQAEEHLQINEQIPNGFEFSFEQDGIYLHDTSVIDDYNFDYNQIFLNLFGKNYQDWLNEVLTRESVIKYQIDEKYRQHQQSGINYYYRFRTDLVYNYQKGIYIESQIYDIENTFKPVADWLMKGDWKSARNILQTITTNQNFTDEMKNTILSDIDNYILNHY